MIGWWAWVAPALVLAGLGLVAGGRYWWECVVLVVESRQLAREIARTCGAIDRRLDSGEGGPRC